MPPSNSNDSAVPSVDGSSSDNFSHANPSESFLRNQGFADVRQCFRDEPENGEKETGKSRFPVFVSPEALKWDGIVGYLCRRYGLTLAQVMPGSGSTAPNTGLAR